MDIKYTTRTFNEVSIEDCYDVFNRDFNTKFEFIAGQEFGTSCYGIGSFESYMTLEEIQKEIADCIKRAKKHKDDDGSIHQSVVLNYCFIKGYLPKDTEVLFNVDY